MMLMIAVTGNRHTNRHPDAHREPTIFDRHAEGHDSRLPLSHLLVPSLGQGRGHEPGRHGDGTRTEDQHERGDAVTAEVRLHSLNVAMQSQPIRPSGSTWTLTQSVMVAATVDSPARPAGRSRAQLS